jgi:predicted AAA+ superfamily ATPase
MIFHVLHMDYHKIKLHRQLDLSPLLKSKSYFLFGPRGTGKSWLIDQTLKEARVYDLLDLEVFRRLVSRPKILEEETLDPTQLIVIDEIQKLPSLLDEVHRLIERKHFKFLLTGSSARKLRRGGSNLLGGRARESSLFPLVSAEIPEFDLLTYLNRGGLPALYFSDSYQEDVDAYIGLYLREEIIAEAKLRSVAPFVRFLDVAALSTGEEINFTSLASDCGVSPSTVENYVQLLEDTLIGFQLPAFSKTIKRKPITRSKLYLFDIGVTNALCRRGEIKSKSELFGKAFEQFIILELRAYLSYSRSKEVLSYWRSTSQFEVDCIVGNKLAIEIKSTELVSEKHLKGLKALKEEGLIERYIVISQDTELREIDGIIVYPWRRFLSDLWMNQLLKK